LRAVIFNSGTGSRMGDLTRTSHKSMARLATGETVFARQVRILKEAGIREFVVTTGPFADQLREAAAAREFSDLGFTFVHNPDFAETNYIYSMHLAREHLGTDALLLHGDLVFNRRIVKRLLADDRPDLALVDKAAPLPQKDFKARVNPSGLVCEVSVDISGDGCYAFQPLYKLSARALGVWADSVAGLVGGGRTRAYAEEAFNEVSYRLRVEAFSYAGDFVAEVDTPADLEEASRGVLGFDYAEQVIINENKGYYRVPEIMRQACAKRPMLVCGPSARSTFIGDYLDSTGIDFVCFQGFSPNPASGEIEDGIRLFRQEGCDFIVSVGGGSAMDTAKCIKAFAPLDSTQCCLDQTPAYSGTRHLAIPTTAGTGSESTHFAVVYRDGEKRSVAHPSMMPDYAILEPELLRTLPDYQKKATLLDALCQCVEAAWSVHATDQSRDYAKKGGKLILGNLFAYFKENATAAELRSIMLGANYSGRAINLAQTTAPHAMSYKLSSMYGIAHGHAVALCMPHVMRYCLDHINDYAAGLTPAHMRAALEMLEEAFAAEGFSQIPDQFEFVLGFLGIKAPALRDPADIDALAASVNAERLANSPIPLGGAAVRGVYEKVFCIGAACAPGDMADAPAEAGSPAATGDAGCAQAADGDDVRYGRMLQELELEILVAFDGFCKDRGLRYYLGEGSMLGAVRHGGFIPWDDDVDVLMPRNDYGEFVRLCREGAFPAGYALDSFETNPRHWVMGAKIQMTRETGFYQPKVEGLALHNGPHIDVFPLDEVPRGGGLRLEARWKTVRFLRRMLFLGSGFSMAIKGKPHRMLMYLVTRVMPLPAIHSLITLAMTRFHGKGPKDYWVNFCSYYAMDKEIYHKDWFGVGKRAAFEGRQLVVPDEAEGMLANIYGADYTHIPSKRRRRARHSFGFDRELVDELQSARPVQASIIDTYASAAQAATPAPASTEVSAKVREVCLEIADVVTRVCRENGLAFCLGEGSLLGAVRHKGFIPWDDDMDILMPREDYEELLRIFGDREIDGCVLLHHSTYPKYPFVLAKAVTTRHPELTNASVEGLPKRFQGLYVDVFPLDRSTGHDPRLRELAIRSFRDMLLFKAKVPVRMTKRRWACKALSYFLTYGYLQERVQRLSQKHNNNPDARYLANYASSYCPSRETFSEEDFAKFVTVRFEDREYPIPYGADAVLAKTYGRYLTLPPDEKRKAKHHVEYRPELARQPIAHREGCVGC